MYGQNLDYQNPTVRAILLEMQRRKVNFGADGVRVDGAQDFKWWDGAAQELAP
jgi:glycosidase